MVTEMTRQEFIAVMQAYVEKLTDERKELKSEFRERPNDGNLSHFITKVGHEISAINNAIREMERQ